MRVLLLAAGFGTRLDRDLRNDTSGKYKHLLGIPKPLLPIGSLPLLSHWMKILLETPTVDQIYVVVNEVNKVAFETWAKEWQTVHLVSSGATSNETRPGAVKCMEIAVKHFKIVDDLIVIGGDTLFYEDFSLNNMIGQFGNFQKLAAGASTVVYLTCKDEEVHKYGIIETTSDGRIVGFLEKPQPSETTSRKKCPCFYMLSKESLPFLTTFLEEKKDEPLEARDATGNFLAYLYPRCPIFASEVSGRFDVGGLDTYIECNEYFQHLKS